MRAVIQRVSQASVSIQGITEGAIEQGFLVLLGIGADDLEEDADWLVRKLLSLRIFADEEGKMNLDLSEVNGSLLVISQFTLHAKTKKGTRPSFIKAAHPDQAIPLYRYFLKQVEIISGKAAESGRFGADMQVSLVNDGPVTILLDTKNKE